MAIEPNFYFSVDDREFSVTDLFESLILYTRYSDGSLVETDITADVDFGGLTPEMLFNDEAAVNTAEYDGVYRGYVSPYYNGEQLEVESLVYIGVKGDATLDGLVKIADAQLVLAYYAQNAAFMPVSLTKTEGDYETLAYFLADVDTESKAGVNTDTAVLNIADAQGMLNYYAKDAAFLSPKWDEIIPSLKEIVGSLWHYHATQSAE